MITVTVESQDKSLINDIWNLSSDDVILEERMLKAGTAPSEITAYIEVASASLVFLGLLFDLIKAHQNNKPSSTKTKIKSSEEIEEINGIASRYKKIIDIEITKEN